VLDELAAARTIARKAAWMASELEELAEEGEVGRAELAAALATSEAAETRLDALRQRRAEAEAALGRLDVERVHARRGTADEGDEP